jgi:hypothetical protein
MRGKPEPPPDARPFSTLRNPIFEKDKHVLELGAIGLVGGDEVFVR